MMQKNPTRFAAFHAFRTTIPVLFGYLAIGVAFGIMLQKSGYPWFIAGIMSLFIYAGALEYMAVSFFVGHTSFAAIAIISLLVNFRHIVYGLSLLDKVGQTGRYKPYIIFAMTDETYALMTTLHYPEGIDKPKFTFFIALFDQCYWIIGSILGALAGTFLPFDAKGVDFALTALFIVLLIDQFKAVKNKLPFVIALVCGAAALVLNKANMLLISVVLAVVALVLVRGRLGEDEHN